MIDPVLNTSVIAIFGILIGCMFLAVAILTVGLLRGERARKRKPAQKVEEATELARQLEDEMPSSAEYFSSAKYLIAGFYGLIIMLIISVSFSPLKMEWLTFFVSFFGSFSLLMGIWSMSKRLMPKEGKIKANYVSWIKKIRNSSSK